MKNMILTYKLTSEQNNKLCAAFPECEISDVSTAFTDLLAIPAAAAVINLKPVSAEEITSLAEVFHYDPDTRICCIGNSSVVSEEQQNFLHIIEEHPDELSDTIAAIQERLQLPLELETAKARMNDLIERITKDIDCDKDASLCTQAAHIENACLEFERISTILENRDQLQAKAKYPYRVSIDSVIFATMIAHNLMQESELEDSDSLIAPEKDWIISLAKDIKEHYDKDVKRNRG